MPDLPLKSSERTEIRKHSFNAVAELYDRVRPGYPELLFDDLVRLSTIPEGARILEIGPGTGQATLPLARRGFSILGLELGDRLARIARRNLHTFPNVKIRHTAFEDWEPEPEAFDMVLAATAFHWIPQKIAYPRSARALKPNGHLALLWNFRAMPDTPFYRDLRAIYKRHAPHLASPRTPDERIERQQKKITSSGRFGPVTVRRYPWQREMSADEYVDLLRTQSDHALLDASVRSELFRAIRRLIEQEGSRTIGNAECRIPNCSQSRVGGFRAACSGGRFVSAAVAVLFLAPKRTGKSTRT